VAAGTHAKQLLEPKDEVLTGRLQGSRQQLRQEVARLLEENEDSSRKLYYHGGFSRMEVLVPWIELEPCG
jgi:hypothetical protein